MQKIIFLNGSSSSGKTSITNSLQKHAPYNFMKIGIDTVISMMPEHLNDWTGKHSTDGFWWKSYLDNNGNICSDVMNGWFADKASISFFSLAKALIDDGHNVIIDEVCLDPQKARHWQKILSQFDTYYIGVSANLEELEKRERNRGDRMIGSARSQIKIVHNLGFNYDLMIDTSQKSPQESSQLILNLLSKRH